jgi:predicted transcriptional regulator of viral defense system
MAGKVRHVEAGGGGREPALAALAKKQHGIVVKRQLSGIGVGDRTIDRWLAVGRLHKLNRGAYAVGHDRVSQRGRWLAAVLACDDAALLSHSSAAALWGLARPRASPIDVTSPRGNQGRMRLPGVRLHRGRIHDEEERAARDRVPVTSVARTLFDLAEVLDLPALERAFEEADRLHLLHLRELERVVARGRGRHALKPIRHILAELRATNRTRSPLEDRFAEFCRDHQIPPPATNVFVLGHEVDALWPAAGLAVELDSFEYHRHRAAFERDRARDIAFMTAGYRVIRVTDRRLDREADVLAEQLRGLLESR